MEPAPPGEEASEETELGNRLCVRVENREVTGEAGLEEEADCGDSGAGLERVEYCDNSILGSAHSRLLLDSNRCDRRNIISDCFDMVCGFEQRLRASGLFCLNR